MEIDGCGYSLDQLEGKVEQMTLEKVATLSSMSGSIAVPWACERLGAASPDTRTLCTIQQNALVMRCRRLIEYAQWMNPPGIVFVRIACSVWDWKRNCPEWVHDIHMDFHESVLA